jgi:hypothetical protein
MDEDISRRETNKQGDVLEDFVERNRRLGGGGEERERERDIESSAHNAVGGYITEHDCTGTIIFAL